MRVLVTGGAGFIGSALVRELIGRGHEVEVLDALTYAGNVENLRHVSATVRLVDVCDRAGVLQCLERFKPDAVAHLAADSHVQRSFGDFQRFIRVNAGGTESVLDACMAGRVKNVLHVSTDEVFGFVPHGSWAYEDAPLKPRNPYSSSKAAAEMVVAGYRGYQGLPVKIARLCNSYGPRQHVEKLIPRVIAKVSAGQHVEIHGTGSQTRDWLHVEDAARGLATVLERGEPGQTYNLPRHCELPVFEVIGSLLRIMGHGVTARIPDRPGGNDMRYGMNAQRIYDLGWKPLVKFDDGLADTVAWYGANPERLELALAEAA